MLEHPYNHNIGNYIARLRTDAKATQAVLAEKSKLDQSRISRIEKGEIVADSDIDHVIDALVELGAVKAADFKKYLYREWKYIEPPSFWNPERACLEITEETLGKINDFLQDDEQPWPLRRQIEHQRDSLLHASSFLNRLNHNIAFIGDMGVGKSTAISFIFDLLVPPSSTEKNINKPVLEIGAGGTTICEVHIKSGPEFGISLLPMSDSEMQDLVSDFCAAAWATHKQEQRETGETASVSIEAERAIRNMSGLTRKKETVDGKTVYHDPVAEIAKSIDIEDEFRTRVLGLMNLEERTRRELWYDSSTKKNPEEWMAETFKAVNNGRLRDVPLPKSIDLLIPHFGRAFGELEITVIDTKGVDDVAIREDLDYRLKDPRTTVIFCSRFNDAPGTSARMLLKHMHQTFSERLDTGKVAILGLPRSGEARSVKDDMGEQVQNDTEGYEFKQMQVTSELAADDLAGVPMIFYNVEADNAETVRASLFEQLSKMRKVAEDRLFDLREASKDIIENLEAQGLNAAIVEVNERLKTFLKGNRILGAREQLAHEYALSTIESVRYAATLWASTRRNGEYDKLNVVHLVGVGAGRDANLRSEEWFLDLNSFLKSLKDDEGLALAKRLTNQIDASAMTYKGDFLRAAQLSGVEVYRESLSQSSVWNDCASEWGRGQGFKMRVGEHLEKWFAEEEAAKLKDRLEQMMNSLWEQKVIAPLLRLVEEGAPEAE